MRAQLILFTCLLLVLTGPVQAGGRRRVAAVSATSAESITVTFTEIESRASEGVVDMGVMSQSKPMRSSRPASHAVTKRKFGIRLDGASANGAARLTASLESFDARIVVRIDGRALGTTPVVIDPHTPIGRVVMHELTIEAPRSAAEGMFAAAIRWDVTTN